MTKDLNREINQQLDRNERRREAANDRYFDKMDRAYARLNELQLVGHLMREGKLVYYINQLTKDGKYTGRTVEFATEFDAEQYLIRNHYV